LAPLLAHLATEEIETVVMEAFERLEAAEVTARLGSQEQSPENLR
jgi:hypothetical protein